MTFRVWPGNARRSTCAASTRDAGDDSSKFFCAEIDRNDHAKGLIGGERDVTRLPRLVHVAYLDQRLARDGLAESLEDAAELGRHVDAVAEEDHGARLALELLARREGPREDAVLISQHVVARRHRLWADGLDARDLRDLAVRNDSDDLADAGMWRGVRLDGGLLRSRRARVRDLEDGPRPGALRHNYLDDGAGGHRERTGRALDGAVGYLDLDHCALINKALV